MAYSIISASDDCYPGTTVLMNKLGLEKQDALDYAEKIATSLRAVEIENELFSAPFSFEAYCDIHRRLFGDIYEWAGELRTIDISKQGTNFCPAKDVLEIGTAIFNRLQSENEFKSLPKGRYVSEISELYHDINMLHPFREGNGRTQRLFFALLIRRAGYEIDFADCDLERLMVATIYAAQGILDYLCAFFDNAITEGAVLQ